VRAPNRKHLRRSSVDLSSDWRRAEIPIPLEIRDRPNASETWKRFLPLQTQLYGSLKEMYNVRKTYEQAQQKHDPYLAPHGFFRRLVSGRNLHAVEFLKRFGPLKLTKDQRFPLGPCGIQIDLAEFWGLHLRFRLVAQLWESRNDKQALSRAWGDVFKCHREASRWEEIHFGSPQAGQWTNLAVPPDVYDYLPLPWERNKQPFDEWLRSTDSHELRESALGLIQTEIGTHTFGRPVLWERCWEPSREKLRPVFIVDSLWSVIWEFFGYDTAGVPWRRCPHCQRFFYPKRRDQFYCTPRQQALASKRVYAARRRAAEHKKKHRHSKNRIGKKGAKR